MRKGDRREVEIYQWERTCDTSTGMSVDISQAASYPNEARLYWGDSPMKYKHFFASTPYGFVHMERKKTENYLNLAINCNWGNCS